MKARLPQGMGKGPQNMNAMIKQAQKMQDDITKVQEEIAEKEFTFSVGGGAVEIIMLGNKNVKAINIKPEVVDPDDIEMLQDLIVSAFNEAITSIEKESEERINKITGGISIPGMF